MSEYDYAYDSTNLWPRTITITITSTQRVQLNLLAPLHSKANFGQIELKKERKKERQKEKKKERKKNESMK